MADILLPSHTPKRLTYDELCRRRRGIEADIAQQELYLIDAAQQLISPQNIVKAISGIVMDNVAHGFSLFDMFNRGWRWVQLALRLIKRFT